MRLDCAPAADLTERDWQTWDAIRNGSPGLSSPYFASEFGRAVARCSPDLFVARISVSREVVGFFPGIILLLDLAKAASTYGVEIVDLGMGTYPYKTRLATGTVDLLHGRIERPSAVAAWRTARRGVRRLAGWLSS
jgi:hypothetical protein